MNDTVRQTAEALQLFPERSLVTFDRFAERAGTLGHENELLSMVAADYATRRYNPERRPTRSTDSTRATWVRKVADGSLPPIR